MYVSQGSAKKVHLKQAINRNCHWGKDSIYLKYSSTITPYHISKSSGISKTAG